MEMSKISASAEDDLEMEMRLAKKLKVNSGRLGGPDDGIADLFEGMPSARDSPLDDPLTNDGADGFSESDEVSLSSKKRKKRKSSKKQQPQDKSAAAAAAAAEVDVQETIEEETATDALVEEEAATAALNANAMYVAPHLRARAGGESEEIIHARRMVRGLLNKLSESNVESITGEVANIFRSIGRSVGCEIVGEEVVGSCSIGPRGNEQYAAVFASFVAGMACLVGIDFSAKLIASVAKTFENEFLKEDGLSLRNLTLLLSCLCIFGACSSDLIYDFLSMLTKRLTEMDVSTILTILQCCGMKLRGDDPTAMKGFILSIQNRVTELKSLSMYPTQDAKPKINNKRMEFMLETICDIKNNKKRSKDDPAHYMRLKKWLQKLRVEDVLLRGLTWSKLLDPNKKGQWWLSGEIATTTTHIEEVATSINKEVIEAQNLMKLAAEHRMNTDIRRAIFCIIMSGEDYLDAFEKIIRLDLSGKQDREIMRVLVYCCLHAKGFNKYYTLLASKLCRRDKNHKFTLQYCIWDHYKELETMETEVSLNLAKFVAEMVSTVTLHLALLKTVDLADPMQLSPRRILHFQMFFEALFENRDTVLWNIFTRVAVIDELEMLKKGLLFFIKQYVVAGNPGKFGMAEKFKIAKKALDNVAGILK